MSAPAAAPAASAASSSRCVLSRPQRTLSSDVASSAPAYVVTSPPPEIATMAISATSPTSYPRASRRRRRPTRQGAPQVGHFVDSYALAHPLAAAAASKNTKPCRNISIHGFCKFQGKGCEYNHDLVRRFTALMRPLSYAAPADQRTDSGRRCEDLSVRCPRPSDLRVSPMTALQ